MIQTNQTGLELRTYVQPSMEVLHLEIPAPLCISTYTDGSTEDYEVDDMFDGD